MNTDIIYANNVSRYPQCISRTKLGNCDPVGGFCTSVPKKICDLQKHESREGQLMDEFISRQAAIDEIEYELEMINSALDSITLDFNARERLRQRRGEAREILNSIQQLPSAQPVDEAYLIDWYISSVDDSDPVWTEAHIEELMNDFYLIPKGVY